jgi:spermidine synthase
MTLTAKHALRLWVHEHHRDILQMHYRVSRSLYSEESEFQHVDIVETPGFGRMLFNDGVVMLSERDEFIYHEMISHVPMFVRPRARRVLVIGGGDGGTVREILRHPGVEYVRLVEIDPKVVEACRAHIPSTAAALDDARVEVAIEDGVAYVARTHDRFDLVLVDSTDPVGPAQPLFGTGFYSDVCRVLTDDGIVVSQAESPFYELEAQRSLLRVLKGVFPRVHLYNYSNLTYPGGLWSFSFCCKGDLCPVGDFDPARVADSGLSFRYYNAAVHRAAFVHPECQAREIQDSLTPLKLEPFAASK